MEKKNFVFYGYIIIQLRWCARGKILLNLSKNEIQTSKRSQPLSVVPKIWDSRVWYIVLLTSSLRTECSFPSATSDIEMMPETKYYSYAWYLFVCFDEQTDFVVDRMIFFHSFSRNSNCRWVCRWFLKFFFKIVSVTCRVGQWSCRWISCQWKNTVGESSRRPVVCLWVVIALIWVFAGHTCHFVGFVMGQLV